MIVLTIAVAATGPAHADPSCAATFQDPRGDVQAALSTEQRSLATDALDITSLAASMEGSSMTLSIAVVDLASLEEHPAKTLVFWQAYWTTGSGEDPLQYVLTAQIDLVTGEWIFDGYADDRLQTIGLDVDGWIDGSTVNMRIPKPSAETLDNLYALSQDSAPLNVTTIGADATAYNTIDVC